MERFPNPELTEKQKKWQEAADRVERITDKLGEPIDPNIKETIIALNVLGIHTSGSCEGHVDRGSGPYVDIESEESEALDARYDAADNEQEKDAIAEEMMRKNLEERKKFLPYLEAFYADRKTPITQQLVIQGRGRGWSRLESQGMDLQEIETEQGKQKNLLAFQSEMRNFTTFLKNQFFSE